MEIRKSGSEKCYTRAVPLSSGINKIWINIVAVSIIFALVRAAAATTSLETLAPPQKRGSSYVQTNVANVCFDELIEGIFRSFLLVTLEIMYEGVMIDYEVKLLH